MNLPWATQRCDVAYDFHEFEVTANYLSGFSGASDIRVLTALWRACGTIPFIIRYTLEFIHPSSFLLMTFLL